MSNRKKSSAAMAEGSDGVELLLQAAQDELLLKLSVDSHISRVVPYCRFRALRSRPSFSQSKSHSQQQKQSPVAPPPKPQQEQKEEEEKKERKSKVVVVDNIDEELRSVLGDDLSIRFAALKASFSSSNPNPTPAATTTTNEIRIGLEKSNGDDHEEDEVEKLIQWAMDVARLDLSPLSDDDDDHMDFDEDDTDSDDDPKHKNKETKSRNDSLLKAALLHFSEAPPETLIQILRNNFAI